jgi:hypothetical protein
MFQLPAGGHLHTNLVQDRPIFQAVRERPITLLQEIKDKYNSLTVTSYNDCTVAIYDY